MADTVLKFQPDTQRAAPPRSRSLVDALRKRRRLILLVIVPLLALLAGGAFYLSGGRYISTDNAYVGAQKVLITPDISGKVARVAVHEGQRVAKGDALFEIDPEPFRIAVAQAQAKLESVRTDFAKLQSNYRTLGGLIDLAQKNVDIKQRDVDRKSTLVANRTGSQADLDTAQAGLVTAQLQTQLARQQQGDVLSQLLGNPDLPIEQFPPYRQASAVLHQARRDLDHTVVRAPITGTATQVDNIQLGRFLTAGMPVFSVLDDDTPWVDANPKETDITYLRLGQKVSIDVDALPDQSFRGTVTSVSPGTGAQFAILPPQNAIGNWVKVVQRVPVRITFDQGQDLSLLRAGMSVNVDIDTGRRRTLGSLFGMTSVAKEATSVAKEAKP
jgi:membrane fusion protein, multidrug efflux system